MATYYVNNAAAGTGSGADWTNAFTGLQAALTAATTNGDIIKVHKTHIENGTGITADTTYTLSADVLVVCVDKDAGDALSDMNAAGGYLGTASTNWNITFAGARKAYFYGICLRVAGASTKFFSLMSSDGAQYTFENCFFRNENTGSTINTTGVRIGAPDAQGFARLVGCTFKFGHIGQTLNIYARTSFENCSLDNTGSAPTNLITMAPAVDPGSTTIDCQGCDWSFSTGSLVADSANATGTITMTACKLSSASLAAPLATQTVANKGGMEVFLFDCHSGDTHTYLAHFDPLGSTEVNGSVYVTAGLAGVSWKITTTAQASFLAPYVSPWIDLYHTGTSAIQPYLEIARTDSASALTNGDVWIEVAYKGTGGSTRASFVNDRRGLLTAAANQDAGAGTGTWTGSALWSGKLQTASITPAETGYLRARVCLAAPAAAVYVDPQIRT